MKVCGKCCGYMQTIFRNERYLKCSCGCYYDTETHEVKDRFNKEDVANVQTNNKD